jgi:predicted metal-dependent hydrolase
MVRLYARAMTVKGRTVLQGGRAKAYRPLPAARRRAALDAFLEAYGRGDAFLAHELLEPAWMGTADLPERDLYQGLIKLAAAEVHAVRGNPLGEANNLRGARPRLASAAEATARGGPDAGLDLSRLLDLIDQRLATLASASSPGEAQDGPHIRLPHRSQAAGGHPR